jgi:cytochrome P450
MPEPLPLPTQRSDPFEPPPDLMRPGAPLRPLLYPDGHVGWLVTGHQLARTVLTDPRFSARAELIRSPVRRPGADPFLGAPALPGWFIDMDRPEHTRFRRLLAGHFSARRIEELRPRIAAIAAEQAEAMAATGQPADLVGSFSLPVPSIVICELLGVPYRDRDAFQRDSTTLFSLDSSVAQGTAAMDSLTLYLDELVRAKRADPGGDVLSRLVESGELTDEELSGVGVLLLTAGHETVAGMLGLGAFLLLCRPELAATLRVDESAIHAAVEELLRYLTIFHFGVPRTPLEDVFLAGELIRAGQCVTISLPAANRDPVRFAAPDQLDLARDPGGHLAFGHGIHQCLGQHLARVELTEGYLALLRRFPGLRLAVAADRIEVGGSGFYHVHRLPVHW